MSKSQRNKGYRGELEFRKLCEKRSFRVISHNEDPHLPDITVEGVSIEIKRGQHIPKTIYDWLEEKDADVLVMRRDKKGWVVAMRADLFFGFLENEFSGGGGV